LVPEAIRLSDQHAKLLCTEFGPRLPEPKDRIGRGRRATSEVAFQSGFQSAPTGRCARVHANTAKPRGKSEIAPLQVGGTSDEGNRLHSRRISLITAIKVAIPMDVHEAVKPDLGLTGRDAN